MLYVKLNVLNRTTSAAPASIAKSAVVNNSAGSLFDTCQVYLNQTLCGDSTNYAIRAYLENFLSYKPDWTVSGGRLCGWFIDEDLSDETDSNYTWKNRSALLKSGDGVELVSWIHHDSLPVFLPTGIDVKIRLGRTSDDFMVIN